MALIKAIVFDYGGVVGRNFDWQKLSAKLPQLARYRDFQDLMSHAREEWKAAAHGSVTQALWQAVGKIADTSGEVVRNIFIEETQPNPKMMELIASLRKNYEVAILSNQVSDWLGEIIRNNNLDERFDLIVTSYDEGISKPDPEIYKRTANRLTLAPNQILFVDDTQRNVDAAIELGMNGILFKNYESFIKESGNLITL